jgi:hypothetical protein
MQAMREALYHRYFGCLTLVEFQRLIPDSVVAHLLVELERLETPEGKPARRVMFTRY